jgi:serine/threonine-protein kinase
MPSVRKCVVKQLRPASNDPAIWQIMKDRFQREAAILEALGRTSDQIPELYASFTENDKFYLVQELIDGETLTKKVMHEGPFDESRVKELTKSLLLVLESVHSRGIIHRDIKPDNIMIRHADGIPVLIDFGAVKEIVSTLVDSRGNPTSTIAIGSPGFMPIEQAAGRPVFASDLYSLGLSAVYMLTGIAPQSLSDPNTGNVNWQQLRPGVSDQFASVINKAIESHFRDRFKTAREMIDALSQSQINPVSTTVWNAATERGGIDLYDTKTLSTIKAETKQDFPHQQRTTGEQAGSGTGTIPMQASPETIPPDNSIRENPKKSVVPLVLLGVVLCLFGLMIILGSRWYYRSLQPDTSSGTQPIANSPSSTSDSTANKPADPQPPQTKPSPGPQTQAPPLQTAPAMNVSGTWRATFVSAGVTTGRYIYKLNQNGTEITGTSYPEGNPKYVLNVSGKLNGSSIRLSWSHRLTAEELAQAAGDPELAGATDATFVVTGTADSARMSGTCSTSIGKKVIGSGRATLVRE